MPLPHVAMLPQVIAMSDGALLRWDRKGSGTPLLMIPGLGGDGSCWGAILPRDLQARGLDPVIFDPRGLGGSTNGTADPSYALYADDAAELIRAAGGAMAVLGWSMGASVALELALRWPRLVKAVVLFCGSADHPGMMKQAGTVLPSLMARDNAQWLAGLADYVMPLVWHSDPLASKAFRTMMCQAGALVSEGIENQRRALRESPAQLPRLADIKVPVLALAGTADRLVPWTEGQKIVDGVPNGRLKLLPGGHGLLYDNEAEVVNATVAFLKEQGLLQR